jgi:hypothetical protein
MGLIVEKMEDFKGCKDAFPYWYDKITKEGFGHKLNVPEHQIAQVFDLWNKMGFLSLKRNKAPHDSKRDRWGGNDSSWMPSTYTVNVEKFNAFRHRQPYKAA